MKKQVAIVSKKMITGGVERALIAMLKHIDYSQMSVDLYLEQLGGKLFDELPSHVNAYQIPRVETVRDILLHPVHTLKKILNRQKLRDSSLPYINQCHLSSSLLLPIKKKYDVAISYHAPNTIPVFYVIDSIQAKKKILWLHGDLYTNAGETAIARHYHARYDQIIAVSKHVEESFKYYHPDFSGKFCTKYNIVDADTIKQKARDNEVFQDDFHGTRIVTVGRLDAQKGIDLAIEACNQLVKKGFNIRWYVCGDGVERSRLENMISQYKLDGIFILLGHCNNPYPYIYKADLYVQPSRTEGYCTTTAEAKILRKAVITTAVAGANEQFINNVSGWIVPISSSELADKLEWCMLNESEIKRIEGYLSNSRTSGFSFSDFTDNIIQLLS